MFFVSNFLAALFLIFVTHLAVAVFYAAMLSSYFRLYAFSAALYVFSLILGMNFYSGSSSATDFLGFYIFIALILITLGYTNNLIAKTRRKSVANLVNDSFA